MNLNKHLIWGEKERDERFVVIEIVGFIFVVAIILNAMFWLSPTQQKNRTFQTEINALRTIVSEHTDAKQSLIRALNMAESTPKNPLYHSAYRVYSENSQMVVFQETLKW